MRTRATRASTSSSLRPGSWLVSTRWPTRARSAARRRRQAGAVTPPGVRPRHLVLGVLGVVQQHIGVLGEGGQGGVHPLVAGLVVAGEHHRAALPVEAEAGGASRVAQRRAGHPHRAQFQRPFQVGEPAAGRHLVVGDREERGPQQQVQRLGRPHAAAPDPQEVEAVGPLVQGGEHRQPLQVVEVVVGEEHREAQRRGPQHRLQAAQAGAAVDHQVVARAPPRRGSTRCRRRSGGSGARSPPSSPGRPRR